MNMEMSMVQSRKTAAINDLMKPLIRGHDEGVNSYLINSNSFHERHFSRAFSYVLNNSKFFEVE